ncbi:alpha beta hydrolase fold-3 [Fusarium phyllophilum]|uniref:Alpha beta hydrolase fold-3 n=1 Tax=Fusarium phyllophilum TaxID=47803 RepID=A0A8H5I3Y0_9HYPO|nr:alpha beta hydrolase fold-3 [Fusarium phyllophilum]
MADYTYFNPGLDPEWVEFAQTWTPPALPKDLAVAKKTFNKSRAELFRKELGPIHGLSTEDILIPARDGQEIPGRLYFPDVQAESTGLHPLYIFCHGGGNLFGDIETEDMHCRLFCVKVPCTVLSVGYRHTPEWVFPTQLHDLFDSINWITNTSRANKFRIDLSNVVLGGVSAGGTMCLGAAVAEIEQRTYRIKGLNISIPSTVHPSRFPHHLVKDGYSSLEQNADSPLLSMAQLNFLKSLLKDDPESPYVSPLLLPDSTLKQFPNLALHAEEIGRKDTPGGL